MIHTVEDSHISLGLNYVKGNFGTMTLNRSRSNLNLLIIKNRKLKSFFKKFGYISISRH